MEGLGINLGYLIIQIIAFIVIYVLLTRFLYDPLSNVLRNRRTRIEKALEDSAVAANARKKTMAIYDTIAEIIERSQKEKVQPEVITDRIAEERIAAGTHK